MVTTLFFSDEHCSPYRYVEAGPALHATHGFAILGGRVNPGIESILVKQSGAMFLINSARRVLLVHPSGRYNRKAPWMPPKEQLERGETPLDAAARAVVEELHLSRDSYRDVRELGSVAYKSGSKRVCCFAALYKGNDDDVQLDWENDRYGWFDFDEARSIVKEEFVSILDSLEGVGQA